jgi:hypothetical protein
MRKNGVENEHYPSTGQQKSGQTVLAARRQFECKKLIVSQMERYAMLEAASVLF